MTGMPKLKPVIVKDPLKALCGKYETALRKRDELRAAYTAAFASDRALSDELTTLEESIKKVVRPRFEGQPRGSYVAYVGATATVTATSKWSRKIDAEGLLDEVPELRDVPGLVQLAINRAMLAELVKTEQLPAEIEQRHVSEQQETTAVKFERTEADESGQIAEAVILPAPLVRFR